MNTTVMHNSYIYQQKDLLGRQKSLTFFWRFAAGPVALGCTTAGSLHCKVKSVGINSLRGGRCSSGVGSEVVFQAASCALGMLASTYGKLNQGSVLQENPLASVASLTGSLNWKN